MPNTILSLSLPISSEKNGTFTNTKENPTVGICTGFQCVISHPKTPVFYVQKKIRSMNIGEYEYSEKLILITSSQMFLQACSHSRSNVKLFKCGEKFNASISSTNGKLEPRPYKAKLFSHLDFLQMYAKPFSQSLNQIDLSSFHLISVYHFEDRGSFYFPLI